MIISLEKRLFMKMIISLKNSLFMKMGNLDFS